MPATDHFQAGSTARSTISPFKATPRAGVTCVKEPLASSQSNCKGFIVAWYRARELIAPSGSHGKRGSRSAVIAINYSTSLEGDCHRHPVIPRLKGSSMTLPGGTYTCPTILLARNILSALSFAFLGLQKRLRQRKGEITRSQGWIETAKIIARPRNSHKVSLGLPLATPYCGSCTGGQFVVSCWHVLYSPLIHPLSEL